MTDLPQVVVPERWIDPVNRVVETVRAEMMHLRVARDPHPGLCTLPSDIVTPKRVLACIRSLLQPYVYAGPLMQDDMEGIEALLGHGLTLNGIALTDFNKVNR